MNNNATADMMKLLRIMLRVMGPHEAPRWLNVPNLSLGSRTPFNVIEAGDRSRVSTAIRTGCRDCRLRPVAMREVDAITSDSPLSLTDLLGDLRSHPRCQSYYDVDPRLCEGPEETSDIPCVNLWQWCDCVTETVSLAPESADPDCPFCSGWGGGYACLVHDFPIAATIEEREAAFM